jgi:hypothetical protein
MLVLKIRHVGEILVPSKGILLLLLLLTDIETKGRGTAGCVVFIKSNRFGCMHECFKKIFLSCSMEEIIVVHNFWNFWDSPSTKSPLNFFLGGGGGCATAPIGPGRPLSRGFYITLNDTTLTIDRHSCPDGIRTQQSEQASGRRPTR